MKILKEKACKIYELSPTYKRFDQKFNMTRRPSWDWVDYGRDLLQNRIGHLKKGNTGYSLKDWALNDLFS